MRIMKKNIFKVLAMLLILAMVIPCVPVVAFAEGEATTVQLVLSGENQNVVFEPLKVESTVGGKTVVEKVSDFGYLEETWVREIATLEDLACFMAIGAVNAQVATHTGRTFILKNDLTVNDFKVAADGTLTVSSDSEQWKVIDGERVYVIYTWTPYGFNDTKGNSNWYQFRGIFDGNGNTISGLYIDNMHTHIATGDATTGAYTYTSSTRTTSAVGFMSNIGNGVTGTPPGGEKTDFTGGVQNLTFENCYVSSTGNKVGMVSGMLSSMATKNKNLVSNVNVTNCYIKGAQYVGGLAGTGAIGEIRDCVVSASIVSTQTGDEAQGFSGGLLGSIGGSNSDTALNIENAVVHLKLTAQSKTVSGFIGVVGKNCTGSISDSMLFGSLTATTANDNIGTMVSSVTGTIALTNCVNYADVKVNGTTKTAFVGAGADKATVTNCVNSSITNAASLTPNLKIEGVQQKASGENAVDARFVASIKFGEGFDDKTIVGAGFEIASIGAYAAGTKVPLLECTNVYQSIKEGEDEFVTAEDMGADYLALGYVTGIPSNANQTIIVRAYCVVDNGDETYTTYYSAYSVFTLGRGVNLGSTTIG